MSNYKTYERGEIAMIQNDVIGEIVKEDISAEAMIQKILGVMAFAEEIAAQYNET